MPRTRPCAASSRRPRRSTAPTSTPSIPAVLRTARAQIHQGVGALELVGLPAAALVLRASESLVQRAAAKPQTLTAAVIADIERASFALLDYLARMLAGKTGVAAVAVPAIPGRAGGGRGPARPSGRPVVGRLALARAAGGPQGRAARRRRRDPRRARGPAAGVDARPATEGRGAADQRDLRQPRRRRRCRGRDAVEARFGRVRGAGRGPARLRPVHQARGVAPARAVPHPRARRVRRFGASRPRPAVLLRAQRAGARGPGAAPGRGARGLRAARRNAGRLFDQRARPLRPGRDRAGAQARRRPRRRGPRWPAARCTGCPA